MVVVLVAVAVVLHVGVVFLVVVDSIQVGQKSGLCWNPLPGPNRH